MTNPKINYSARGSLPIFIKGHLLESTFDKTYFHHFEITTNKVQSNIDLNVWEKTPLIYLSAKDKIILLHLKGKKLISQFSNTPEGFGACSNFLSWTYNLLNQGEVSNKLKEAQHIWAANTLLLLALTSECQNQSKFLRLAIVELENLEQTEIATHPYIFYLRGLIFVALGQWEKATSAFHRASAFTHNPTLYKLLINLYISLDLPDVAAFFGQKLARLDKELVAS